MWFQWLLTKLTASFPSDKAVGTAVYNRQREHLGSVYNLMIHKYSGQIAYAVMSFGGFLGMGEAIIAALEDADLRHAQRRLCCQCRPHAARESPKLWRTRVRPVEFAGPE
jgi:hypothetical protein